jgi:hypothetical protein
VFSNHGIFGTQIRDYPGKFGLLESRMSTPWFKRSKRKQEKRKKRKWTKANVGGENTQLGCCP